jgi:hypothetical protein
MQIERLPVSDSFLPYNKLKPLMPDLEHIEVSKYLYDTVMILCDTWQGLMVCESELDTPCVLLACMVHNVY